MNCVFCTPIYIYDPKYFQSIGIKNDIHTYGTCEICLSQSEELAKQFITYFTTCGGQIERIQLLANYIRELNYLPQKKTIIYRGLCDYDVSYNDFHDGFVLSHHTNASCWTYDYAVAQDSANIRSILGTPCKDRLSSKRMIISMEIDIGDEKVLIDTTHPDIQFPITTYREKCLILRAGTFKCKVEEYVDNSISFCINEKLDA